jgi:hypothetical protein
MFALALIAPSSRPQGEPLLLALSAFVTFGVIIAAIIQCYRRNGGRTGKDFLKRFLSITWVVGWRSFVIGVPALLGVLILVLSLFHPGKVQAQFIGLALSTAYWILVIAIAGRHFQQASRAA